MIVLHVQLDGKIPTLAMKEKYCYNLLHANVGIFHRAML